MKKNFLINCDDVFNLAYESDKDSSLPIITQIRVSFHLLFCPGCAKELSNLRELEEVMLTDFIPPSPEFGELVMECLSEETNIDQKLDAPAGFSFRSWVIIGFFVLLSLPSSFFGMNFVGIANVEELSFLLPLSITIGIVVTCYGALFIGSHLKELSNRFGLR